jgi:DNA-binding HxlR family transcriptional regulator
MAVTRRSYQQYCALALALDRIGDRWTLLILRELLISRRRYTDLRDALPGIATNLLAERLQRLERDGIVAVTTSDAGATLYELSDVGRELEPPILALVRWGGRWLADADPALQFRAEWLVVALRALLAGASDLPPIEFRVDGETMHAQSVNGNIDVQVGPAPAPTVVITADRDSLMGIASGELSLLDAMKAALVQVVGDPKTVRALARALRDRPQLPPR